MGFIALMTSNLYKAHFEPEEEFLGRIGSGAETAEISKLFSENMEWEIAGDTGVLPWIEQKSGRGVITDFVKPELRSRATIFWGSPSPDQITAPPMASRSSGGTNFGEGLWSQSNVAATSGLCLFNPPHAAESLTTRSRPITPDTAPHRKTAVRKAPGCR
jgi:hypothetical protein